MHTREADRGRGIGRALVEAMLGFAGKSGYTQVSLETGTTDEFAAARTLYVKCGFRPCGPFAGYSDSPYNTFLTIRLQPDAAPESS